MILAFDPGVCTGWAVGDDSGLLRACGVLAWRQFSVTYEARSIPNGCSTLVIEKPQVYRAGRQKGAQADVVDTAVRAGILCGWVRPFTAHDGCVEFFPTPAEWKKNVDKDMHNARVLAALAPEERALVPKLAKGKLHNAVDAIGLLKWAARQICIR